MRIGDHEWKVGAQFERGDGHGYTVIPTGVRYLDRAGQPFQSTTSGPSVTGGVFNTASAFATDTVRIGARLTIDAGLRFDYSRALSEDLPAVDMEGHETSTIIRGAGTMYSWRPPRAGSTFRLSSDGRASIR